MLSPSQARLASSSLSAALANAEATVDEALRSYRGAPVSVDLTGYGQRVVEEIEATAKMAGWVVEREGVRIQLSERRRLPAGMQTVVSGPMKGIRNDD